MSKVVLLPIIPEETGGPGTFSLLFAAECASRGIDVAWGTPKAVDPDAVLLISATRKLCWLHRLRRKGARVVQRLDGIQSLRLRGFDAISLSDYWRFPARDQLIAFTRRFLAHSIVYQSQSAREVWTDRHGSISKEEHTIYNGTDTEVFHPSDDYKSDLFPPRILCVEGNIPDDNATLCMLNELCTYCARKSYPLTLVGRLTSRHLFLKQYQNVELMGTVARSAMPEIYRRHHVYVSIDRNPACPNALIEAMSSGLPIVGYRWGSLDELTNRETGVLAEVGCDPWSREVPNLPALTHALEECIARRSVLAVGARERAVRHYSISQTADAYLRVLFPDLKP